MLKHGSAGSYGRFAPVIGLRYLTSFPRLA